MDQISKRKLVTYVWVCIESFKSIKCCLSLAKTSCCGSTVAVIVTSYCRMMNLGSLWSWMPYLRNLCSRWVESFMIPLQKKKRIIYDFLSLLVCHWENLGCFFSCFPWISHCCWHTWITVGLLSVLFFIPLLNIYRIWYCFDLLCYTVNFNLFSSRKKKNELLLIEYLAV